jgi:SAM-dependent methyltransferase
MLKERRELRLFRRQRRDWEELASYNPFGAILRDPARVREPWRPDAFFATGERDAEVILTAAARHRLPQQRRRALDFGCGVGRVSRALAKHFDEVVGVDISPRMISWARDLNSETLRCSFLVSSDPDLRNFDSGTFDLVLCLLVLQHLPNGRDAERYIREFVRLLRPGGVAAFQVPSRIPPRRRVQSRRRMYAGLRALGVPERLLLGGGLDPIRTTAVPEQRIIAVVENAGGAILESLADDAAGPHVPSRRYIVTRS